MSEAEEYLKKWANKIKLEIKLENKFDYFYPREQEVEELVNLAVSLARQEERDKDLVSIQRLSNTYARTVKDAKARVEKETAKKIQKIVVSYERNIMKHHVKENTAQAFQVGAKTILQDVQKQIKNRFLSKPRSKEVEKK